MIHTLENSAIQLTVNPALARWSVAGRARHSPALVNVQVGVSYRRGRARLHALERWPAAEVSAPETVASAHGPLRQLRVEIGAEEGDLHAALTFALPEGHPLLLWQLAIENRGGSPILVDRLDLLSAGFLYPPLSGLPRLSPSSPALLHLVERNPQSGLLGAAGDFAFFANGWQSWSYAGVYGAAERFRRTRLGPLRAPTDVNAGTPQPRRAGLFASDLFGVLGDRTQRCGLLAGFLSQLRHFGSLEALIAVQAPALRLWANGDGARLNPGAGMASDWACLHFLHLDEPDPLGPYLEAVARQHGLDVGRMADERIPAGWCSWYQFSTEDYRGALTAQDIRENAAAIAAWKHRLPLEILQIDDGFESRVGDWFSFDPGFPEGVAPLAAEIRQAGLTPGLWLAPFILHPRARLAAAHPDWLLRGRLGLPANAGYLWGTFAAALDLTHPDALRYAAEVVHTAVHEWGYPYLKLDFLYAAALPGRRRDPTRTRAQVLREGLQALRAAAGPQAFLLGCGCPLGSGIGLVDAMRIGTDTTRRWLPSFKNHEDFFRREPNLPSARNASHNALARAALHRRWWINDPDCLLLRPETRLSWPEVQSLATVVALSGGSLMLSDHLPTLPEERLRLAENLLPPIGRRPHVLDWFDSPTPRRVQLDLESPAGAWHLLAAFNWEDSPQDVHLRLSDFYLDPQLEYLGREFWSGSAYRLSPQGAAGGRLAFHQVPAHGVILLAVRPRRPRRPQYLGSDLHISQGLEVAAWEWQPRGLLSLKLQRPGPARGTVELSLPRPPSRALLEGEAIEWQASIDGCYRFPVEFERAAWLQLHL